MLRIFRSSRAHFAEDVEVADRAYGAETLRQLADLGFNGVWIRMVNRRLLKHPKYPTFGDQADACLPALRRVIERADKCGIKVYAYQQEPLGLPTADPFWKEHPELAGATYNHQEPFTSAYTPMTAFCTSTHAGRDYVEESSERLLRELPGLGGIITITASEFIAHCYSKYFPDRGMHHGDKHQEALRCPRCRERHPSEVVAEILNRMRAGMDHVRKDVPLIAWNWSWQSFEPDPQPRILSQLEKRIEILIDFERGGYKIAPDGNITFIDEYALSYAGPSERFLRLKMECDRQQRKVHAKLQIGTTHEVATVSNLPLIGNLLEKTRSFKKLTLAGFLGCWSFGLLPSLNLRAFNFFLSSECPSKREEALVTLAQKEFPGCDAGKVVEAREKFGEAFDHYPFSVPFLYFSPINYSLALPFEPGPLQGGRLGRSWVMDPRGDDAAQSCHETTPEEIGTKLTKLLNRWNEGLSVYEQALKGSHEELDAARAVSACVRSTRNFYRLYGLKRNWSEEAILRYREIIRDELETLQEAIPLFERDPRQGFHQECGAHMVTVEAMHKKRDRLAAVLNRS